MPTLTGKSFSQFYKNLLGINQSSNTGVDSTTRVIHDGLGQETSMSISDDVFQVQPITDDTTGAFLVKSVSGSTIFACDTTNLKITAGRFATAVNTQYAYFGCSSTATQIAAMAADTHYAIPFVSGSSIGAIANIGMGSSTSSSFNDTNPSSTLSISNTAHEIVQCYMYVPDQIVVDAVHWLSGADAATGESTAAHLMSYSLNTTNSYAGGDLTSGTVVADGSNLTNSGYEQIHYQSMTIQNADVSAGKVLLFTFAADTVNSDYSINAVVKYHIL